MLAVHFGAGSIGRGFIGDLLHSSGYEILMVDVNPSLNQQINQSNSYKLYIIEQGYTQKTINNVTALSPITERDEVIQAIVKADLITTAVWADNLPKIAPILVDGLLARLQQRADKINLIVCENAPWNGEIMRKVLLADGRISESELDSLIALPSTAVDRLVLNAQREGQDVIDIGVDHELVIDVNGLNKRCARPIRDAIYTDVLGYWLERKLFIINGGHAWAGYIGWLQGYDIIQDVFNHPELAAEVRATMLETAALLAHKKIFSFDELSEYVDFACRRFSIPGVVDTVARVCRSPIRKLALDDRLVAPAVQCEQFNLPNDQLITGIAAALHYFNKEDSQSFELQDFIKNHGISDAVEKYCGIKKERPLHKKITSRYQELQEIKAHNRN